jgi:hypothetical protein
MLADASGDGVEVGKASLDGVEVEFIKLFGADDLRG